MSDAVLVTYSTKYGATKEVAEVIAGVMRDGGLDAQVQPMRQVHSVDMFRAVVLGAPLYIGRWPKEARGFLSRHQAALTSLPVALFSGGPISADEAQLAGARDQIDKELAQFPWLSPLSVLAIGGRYDPGTLNLADGLLAKLPVSPLKGAPASDSRDWDAIRAWARELVERLQAG